MKFNVKDVKSWASRKFEFLAHCEWHPFGVEVKENE